MNKINRIAIVSGIATIISVVTFFIRGAGSMAIAQNDIDTLKEFKTEQIQTNKTVFEDVTTIKNDVKWIAQSLDKLTK